MVKRIRTGEKRLGPRYLTSLNVRAAWADSKGQHVAEGTTENVGPEGALVHFPRDLPEVGSRVELAVVGEKSENLQVVTEVLRLEHNAARPLAALQVLDALDEWRGLVWEPSAPRPAERLHDDEYNEDDEGESVEGI